jgi:hypothetical protein
MCGIAGSCAVEHLLFRIAAAAADSCSVPAFSGVSQLARVGSAPIVGTTRSDSPSPTCVPRRQRTAENEAAALHQRRVAVCAVSAIAFACDAACAQN